MVHGRMRGWAVGGHQLRMHAAGGAWRPHPPHDGAWEAEGQCRGGGNRGACSGRGIEPHASPWRCTGGGGAGPRGASQRMQRAAGGGMATTCHAGRIRTPHTVHQNSPLSYTLNLARCRRPSLHRHLLAAILSSTTRLSPVPAAIAWTNRSTRGRSCSGNARLVTAEWE